MPNEAATAGQFFYLAPWVVLLPLIGLLVNLLAGKRLGDRGAGVVASAATGLAFVVSVLLALSLSVHPEPVVVHLADWITAGSLSVPWNFRVDTLSVTMMLVVSGVGTLIHVYAIGYMYRDVRHNGDPARYTRFFVYLNLFIVAMMILVSGDSYLMTFVGWEGVGLCSYLLIGFWFEKGQDGIGNAKAAKKAFITNRIGDFGFLIAMFLIFWGFGSLEYDEVFAKAAQVAQSNPGLDPGDHPLPAAGGHRQIGPAAAVRLAAGRDGGPDARLGADPCGHDGHRRGVPGGPLVRAVLGCAGCPIGRGLGGRADRPVCRHDRRRPV